MHSPHSPVVLLMHSGIKHHEHLSVCRLNRLAQISFITSVCVCFSLHTKSLCQLFHPGSRAVLSCSAGCFPLHRVGLPTAAPTWLGAIHPTAPVHLSMNILFPRQQEQLGQELCPESITCLSVKTCFLTVCSESGKDKCCVLQCY